MIESLSRAIGWSNAMADRAAAFSLEHYGELLDAAKEGGYTFARFDHEPKEGDLFVRHDVDLDLEAALVMAELEADRGVHATYLVMVGSEFYNAASPTGERAIARLRWLGHSVGLHAVWPRTTADARLDAVASWHNPEVETILTPIGKEVVNVMTPPWFQPDCYRSDSNQRWKHDGRCPCRELRQRQFDWLQLLVHPEVWVFEGPTMVETMRAFVDDRCRRLWQQLEEDRIDVDPEHASAARVHARGRWPFADRL